MESINVKIDESNLLKTKKGNRNPNILEDQIDIEWKQQKEEEEQEQQDEKKPDAEQGNNQHNFQTPYKTPKNWVQKNHPT